MNNYAANKAVTMTASLTCMAAGKMFQSVIGALKATQ